jgi:CO/xanthine dehydrogenase Mo-binding subunit
LAAAPNCWAIETAIDALADKAGRDPLAFRLDTIAVGEPRLAAVLKAAADRARWQLGATAPGHALGLACGIYKNMSYAAVVAEVDLSGETPRVHRLCCAHDCGLVINPDQVRAQVEGNLIWGLGMALTEELVVEGGRIVAESHADYTVPGYAAVPDIEIELIEGAAEPTGAGETAIVAATAAITNAIARATGRRVTRLPYRG